MSKRKDRKQRHETNLALAGERVERARLFDVNLFANGYASRSGKHICSKVLHVEVKDNSVDKMIWGGPTGGLLTITIVTEDWRWTKAEGLVTFLERRSANKILAWWIRRQTVAGAMS